MVEICEVRAVTQGVEEVYTFWWKVEMSARRM